jgi:UDP-glucose-4-epimerase GalE
VSSVRALMPRSIWRTCDDTNTPERELHLSILIVGGAGYIGSHTAKLVAEAGLEPVIFDNLSSGHRWALKWGKFEEGDLADRAAIDRVLERHAVEAVIDFAAHIEVGESVKNPRKYFRNNVVCTMNLLDAMVDRGIKDIVFSSTAAVYGDPTVVPIPEDHPLLPVNPYGESKLFVERILRWYGDAYGLRWGALRYFNAAGADPGGAIGEDHDPESHLIPLAIKAALGLRGELQIFGTDYPTPDGTPLRDYIHVVDLAHAHLLALRHLAAGKGSFAANVGTGQGHSVREVIETVERVSGRPVPRREVGRRPGDAPALVADPGRAAQLLEWRPRYPALLTIVEHAWKWHASRAA